MKPGIDQEVLLMKHGPLKIKTLIGNIYLHILIGNICQMNLKTQFVNLKDGDLQDRYQKTRQLF